MRIAVVKPDWRIRGGFELVLDSVESDLVSAGHEVRRITVDVPGVPRRPFGRPVPDAVWEAAPEWFGHMALLDTFRGQDLGGADLVLTTQPPSYAVPHPRRLALFYHHARAFYDLEDVWVSAGRAAPEVHRTAAALLRSAEAEDLAGVGHFLAGSPRVQERLRHFHGDVDSSLYLAPPPLLARSPRGGAPGSHVLVVSRHEFTKRTELALQALAMGTVPGVFVGDGGRLPYVRTLAARYAAGLADPHESGDTDLWLNLGVAPAVDGPAPAHIRLAGRVDDDELDRLYAGAICLVAPAYDEDYGLTVLEAMARGVPVVVCRDGGGLVHAVEDGVNGLVVEPTGVAIAAAVALLAADPGLAVRLGAAGRETAAAYTAARARTQLLDAVDRVMSGTVA